VAHKKRPVVRWLVNVVSAVSLILCLATVGLWVRSYSVGDIPQIHTRDSVVSAYSSRGTISFGRTAMLQDRWDRNDVRWVTTIPLNVPRFTFNPIGGHSWAVTIPHWSFVLVFSILPTICIIRFVLHRKRLRKGHCPVCNYDLRATPQRCPECGNVPKATA
jgi:hypothetical protein